MNLTLNDNKINAAIKKYTNSSNGGAYGFIVKGQHLKKSKAFVALKTGVKEGNKME